MKDDSAYRSLVPKPGWIPKSCERCNREFWLTPAQFKNNIRYCASTCRYEPALSVIERRTVKGGHPNGCWICDLTPSVDYPLIKTKGEMLRAARVVLEAALGRPIAPALLALHRCNNPRCVRVGPEHIYEGTQQENIKYCAECGRNPDNKGEKSSSAKLTDEKVKYIRENPDGLTGVELAAMHGVQGPCISRARNHHSWKHI